MADLPTGTVTFLFTDIEGSTELLTALGGDYPQVLSRHNAIVRAEIARTDGVEVKTEGDAFFAVFGEVPAALDCAAAAQRQLATEDWPAGRRVRVRMGLHTGIGALSEGDYVGLDVHLAARVAAAAHGGQVLLSEATRGLAGHALPARTSLRELGEHLLKDFAAPVTLFQLVVDGLEQDFPPVRSLRPGNLPEQLTSFVGREAELAEVEALLDRARLVTLTGPGGTGKTRLSIEAARRFSSRVAGGAWFVPLDTVSDPDLVLPAIGRALAVREEADKPIAESLAAALGSRRLLMVLDNVEQVVDAGPELAKLLAAAPGPRLLCSSREPLRVAGEQQYEVPPLDDDPAARLFVERARLVKPGYDPTPADREAIAAICRAVDRLPLAIELAAAWIRLFPPAILLGRLSDRLGLTSGSRDLPERQRTLRGAIDWSYDLLDESERGVFARLAVFAGGADLAAIEAVVDPAREIAADSLDVLSSLVEKSLLRAEDGPSGAPRFRMLETIREYAAEKLAASGASASAVRVRHLDYFVAFAEAHEPELTGGRADAAFAELSADHDNIRAAIEWSLASGKPAGGLRIGGAIWRFWQQRGHLSEGNRLMARLLAAPGNDVDPQARARGLTGYGGVLYWQGNTDAARTAYEEALALYRQTGDEGRVALGLFDLAFTVSIIRDLDAARRMFEESAAIYARLGDEKGRLMVGEGRSAVAMLAGDLVEARDIAEVLVADYQRLDMKYRLADTLTLLCAIYVRLGDADHARDRLARSLRVWNEIGDVSSRVGVIQFGASLAVLEGRLTDAARLLGALRSMRDRGEPFLTPSEVIGLPDPEIAARAGLSAADFEAAFSEGRALPIESALEQAAK